VRRIAAVIVFVAALAATQQAAASCPTVAYKVTAKRWVRVKKTKRVHGRLVVVRRDGRVVYVRKLERYTRTLHREVCATRPSPGSAPAILTVNVLPEGCGEQQASRPGLSPGVAYSCVYSIRAAVVGKDGNPILDDQVELSTATADATGEDSFVTGPGQIRMGLHWVAISTGTPYKIKVEEIVYPAWSREGFSGEEMRSCSIEGVVSPVVGVACPEGKGSASAWWLFARFEDNQSGEIEEDTPIRLQARR
jgi:hypothetical protein